MAQTLIAYYCFNDNDAALVHDFSVNEWHSTAETGFTISTDTEAIGKVGVFNGTTTYLNFGNVSDLNAVTGFSIVCRFKVDSYVTTGLISDRAGHHTLQVLDTGAIHCLVYDSGAVDYDITTTYSLDVNTWYTLVMVWDGENVSIYLDTLENVESAGAAFSEMETNTNVLTIGASSAPAGYFDGSIEMISYYSKALNDDEINAVMESPTGIRYEAGDGMIQTGDLVYNNSGGKEVCTWSEEFDEMKFSDNEQQLFADGELQIFKN